MKISEYKNIFEQEDNHFFYISNHRIILSLVKKYCNKKNLKILDAGCGTGLLAKKLSKFGEVWAIDISTEALKYAKKRKLKLKKGSITEIPFKESLFDLVTCIDVINHQAVKSDIAGMREIYRVLKPGGLLVIRTSANPWLKLVHDKHVYIRERYSKDKFEAKLKKADFNVKRISYINMILLPLAALTMTLEMLRAKENAESGVTRVPGFLNKILIFLLSSEAYLLPKLNLPFGIGLVAVCQKPISSK
jgi:ubiquinone/menaquinone biosynthesis C-methylase UbiE